MARPSEAEYPRIRQERGIMTMEFSLDQIAKFAREHPVSAAERRAQRVSMIAGLRPHNSTLTREQVSQWVDHFEGHEPIRKKETV